MCFFSNLYFIKEFRWKGHNIRLLLAQGHLFCSVYGGNFNASVMANPQTESYDRTLSGNILVLGSSGGGKMSLVQEIASNSMFGKLEGVYWVSGINLSKKREGEIECCFEAKVDFLLS